MCLATPSKVIKIEKDEAIVQSGHHQHRVNLDLIKDVKIGDYLLIHNEMALNKMPQTEAKKILKMINDHSTTNVLNK